MRLRGPVLTPCHIRAGQKGRSRNWSDSALLASACRPLRRCAWQHGAGQLLHRQDGGGGADQNGGQGVGALQHPLQLPGGRRGGGMAAAAPRALAAWQAHLHL